jgi:hypothetical protein
VKLCSCVITHGSTMSNLKVWCYGGPHSATNLTPALLMYTAMLSIFRSLSDMSAMREKGIHLQRNVLCVPFVIQSFAFSSFTHNQFYVDWSPFKQLLQFDPSYHNSSQDPENHHPNC